MLFPSKLRPPWRISVRALFGGRRPASAATPCGSRLLYLGPNLCYRGWPNAHEGAIGRLQMESCQVFGKVARLEIKVELAMRRLTETRLVALMKF
jgi:hypothetical protein